MKKFKLFAALCCAALLFAACEKDEPKNNYAATGYENGYGYVVLGLPSGTKWATCNVGATSPEGYGNYYAWGETTTKDTYSWDTYKYGSEYYYYDELTKYNTTDGRTTLEAADDAATANWGAEWRMPTSAEWQELIDNCTWTRTTLNGVNGYKVKGKNGKTIFLPAAGSRNYYGMGSAGYYGGYWSSSLYYTYSPSYAWYASFNSDTVSWGDDYRCYGLSVRPVLR